MYPRPDQFRLSIKYQFAAAKYTSLTAGILLAASLLQIWFSILLRTTVFAIAGPLYLICESLYRLYQSRVRGLPAGSLVGYLLRLVISSPR